MELQYADGSREPRPTRAKIRSAIDHMNTRKWFVILDNGLGGFVQVAWGTQVNLRDGDFLLETKGEQVEGHLATVVTSLDDVHEAFAGFSAGDLSWMDRHRWRPASV